VNNSSIKRICITSGEPAGIGPDIVLQICQQHVAAELVVVADEQLLQSRAEQLGLKLSVQQFDHQSPPSQHIPGTVKLIHTPLASTVSPGKLNSANSPYVLKTLDIAAQGVMKSWFDAIVTCPVSKSIINDAGHDFCGHTEYFAKCANVDHVVMLLIANNLRIALATTHLPLRQIADKITTEGLVATLQVLHHDLQQKIGIAQPHIFVCGLNPHAGEGGHLGDEEINIIEPAINLARNQGIRITGPLSADTIYRPKNIESADVFLAMYHDQGLPVLKYAGFGEAVNITLGLPFIRTSVDHGTAIELAGTGKASPSSLANAIHTAMTLANNICHTQ